MKTNQKGFSVVEVIMVIVIVGLIGTVGWLVYDRQQDNDQASQADTQTTQESLSETVETDPYQGWATCTDPVRKVSLRYPAEWESTAKDDISPCESYKESEADDRSLVVTTPKSKNIQFRVWYSPLYKTTDMLEDYQLGDDFIVLSVEPFTTYAGKKLNIVRVANEYNENKNYISEMYVTDKTYSVGDVFKSTEPNITTSSGKLFVLRTDLGSNDGGSADSYSFETYKKQPAYDDVIKTLRSITY